MNATIRSYTIYLLKIVVLGISYYAAAQIGLRWATVGEQVTLIWFPTGIALTALFLLGSNLWPGVALGALAVNLSTHAPLFFVFAAVGNTLQAVTAVFLLRKLHFNPQIGRLADVFALLISAFLSAAISAGIGSLLMAASGVIVWSSWPVALVTWWLGDALGVLVIAPALLTWGADRSFPWRGWRLVEFILLVSLSVLVCVLVFFPSFGNYGWFSFFLVNALFPLSLWAGIRFRVRGSAAIIVLTSVLAVVGSSKGLGIFVTLSSEQAAILLWSFINSLSLVSLVLAVRTGELTQVTAALMAEAVEREKAETAVRASEARYRTMIEQSPLSTAVFRLDGSIVLVNPAFSQIWPIDPHDTEFILTQYNVFKDKQLAASGLLDLVLEGFSGRSISMPAFRYKAVGGKNRPADFPPIWLKIFLYPIKDDLGEILFIVAILEDVTESQKSVIALRDSEIKHLILLNSIRAPILALTEELDILFCNTAYSELVGLPIESLEGAKLPELFPSFTRSRSFAVYLHVLANGEDEMVEGIVQNTHLRSWVYRTPWGILAIGEDVTTHRQTEGALRESEARYRTLFQKAHDAIFLVTAVGDIVDANQRACDLFGYERDVLLQMKHGALLADEGGATPPDEEPNEEGAPFEQLYRHRNGRLIPVEITNSTIQTGSSPLTLSIVRDITERKQAEETLRQTQKTESLGILAGGIAHDFNNLLVAMLGQSTLALAKLSPEHSARSHIEKSVKAAEHAAHLTRQLLAYSGRGQFEKHTINLNVLLQDNLHLFQIAIPKHISLQQEFSEPLPTIEGDLGQIQQVVMNLIINAVEAIGDRAGVVRLHTSSQTINPRTQGMTFYGDSPLQSGFYVCLEVEDNGPGMTAETQAKIFDPFFSTKFTGRGLGLAAVLGIVRGHKGGLQVSSEPGRGTTFRLFFPAAQATAVPIPAQHKIPTAPLQAFVLVIDDETMVREAVADILGLRNIQVIQAGDGQAGLQAFQAHQDKIQLVLLDLSMPGLNGEETCIALRQINPHVKIILSSGYSQSEISERHADLDVTAFLQKPYSAEDLLEITEKYLG
ncbi:MAG: PAS domain S-box protein [Chloroflexi bacterium]|nr:PAS domain S-box protein [Chloroflexota bacterium]MBP7041503.1 PAS domain S-box protein [Chloroflexota bacterium]